MVLPMWAILGQNVPECVKLCTAVNGAVCRYACMLRRSGYSGRGRKMDCEGVCSFFRLRLSSLEQTWH